MVPPTLASEVKALWADASAPRAFSKEGLEEALTFWAPIAPQTPSQGVPVEPAATSTAAESVTASPTIIESSPPPSKSARPSAVTEPAKGVVAPLDSSLGDFQQKIRR